jgi:AcrR family transcriptional regulator
MTTPRQPRTAGISKFAAARRENNLGNLRLSAEGLLRERGYVAVSVDDIAKGAGVTRRTFYKHFDGKLEIAMDMLARQMEKSKRAWGAIAAADPRDPEAIRAWIEGLIAYYDGNPITRMMLEIGVFEPESIETLQSIAPIIMGELGRSLPAFAFTGDPAERERWAEAWMLVMQIMNHAYMLAAGFSMIEPALTTQLLARSFHAFVQAHDAAAPPLPATAKHRRTA